MKTTDLPVATSFAADDEVVSNVNGQTTRSPLTLIAKNLPRIVAVASKKEHQLILDEDSEGGAEGGNAVLVQNKSPNFYSAVRFRDSNGKEVMAVGYGNESTGDVFQGWNYVEVSDAENGNDYNAHGLVIIQSTTYNGELSYGFHPRVAFYQDGTLVIFGRGNTGLPNDANFTFDKDLPILTGGCFGSLAHPYFELRGLDNAHYIRLRDEGTTGAEVDRNTYGTVGDTLASGAGHVFKTGGARVDQTVKVLIANDGTAIRTPAATPSTATFTSATLYLDESGGAASPVLKIKVVSSNGTVKTGTVTLS